MRVNRCKEILNRAIHMKESLGKFIGDATRLTDKLLELCNKPVPAKIKNKQINECHRITQECHAKAASGCFH